MAKANLSSVRNISRRTSQLAVLLVAAAGLAACQTTGDFDGFNSQPTPNSGGTVINFGVIAPTGTWTLTDDFGRRCTISFSTTPLAGAAGAFQVSQNGFCSSDFTEARGWMNAGAGLVLTNSQGRIVAQLTPDDKGGYAGTYTTVIGPHNVQLARGY